MPNALWLRLKLAVVTRPAIKAPIKRARYAALRGVSRALGPGIDPAPQLIGYHTVGDGRNDLSVTVEQFRAQLDWLVRHDYRTLTLRQWRQRLIDGVAIEPRTVLITFDDGFRNVCTVAAPLLAERGMVATVFVLADYIGAKNTYDRPFHAPELPLLGWDHIERLQRIGWDIQSHGAHHYPLYRLTPEALEEETAGSKARLEVKLGEPVDFFCYPYGAFDARAVDAVRRAGYVGAVTCRPGRLPGSVAGDWHRLPRTLIDGHLSPADFASLFCRGFAVLAEWQAAGRRRKGAADECAFDELDALRHLGVFARESALTSAAPG